MFFFLNFRQIAGAACAVGQALKDRLAPDDDYERHFVGEVLEYANLGLDMAREHRKTVVVVGVAAGAVLACALAPGIAAMIGRTGLLGVSSTGTPIATLTGAALQQASLAALGGGAISAGGAGVAGGVVTVTVTSAVGSGTAAGVIASAGTSYE